MGIPRWNVVTVPKVKLIKLNLKSLKCGSVNAQLVNGKSLLIIDYTLQNNLDLVFVQETRMKEDMNKYDPSLIALNSQGYKF